MQSRGGRGRLVGRGGRSRWFDSGSANSTRDRSSVGRAPVRNAGGRRLGPCRSHRSPGCREVGYPTGFGRRRPQVDARRLRHRMRHVARAKSFWARTTLDPAGQTFVARWRSGCPREPHELETVGSNPTRATRSRPTSAGATTSRPLRSTSLRLAVTPAGPPLGVSGPFGAPPSCPGGAQRGRSSVGEHSPVERAVAGSNPVVPAFSRTLSIGELSGL